MPLAKRAPSRPTSARAAAGRATPGVRGARERASELLRQAIEIPGLPGHEGDLGQWFERQARALGAEVRHSRLGNCVALMRGGGRAAGPRQRLLLAAHADAIGLIVTAVTSEGFLRVAPMGGVDPRLLPAQDVWVHGTRRLPGVFGSIPPHFQTPKDRKERYEFEDLFVDVGLPRAEARRTVRVGDLVSLRAPLVELQEGRMSGRAMDNRASVVAMLLAMERLGASRRGADVYAVTTAQEEVGRACAGALTSAFAVEPHAALALDVTHAEAPGLEEWNTFKLDGGPVFCMGPNVHPAVLRGLIRAAAEERIPYQLEPAPTSTGTDAMDLQSAGTGVPTGVVGIPIRYMHSAVETLCISDLERAGRVVARFASSADRGFEREED